MIAVMMMMMMMAIMKKLRDQTADLQGKSGPVKILGSRAPSPCYNNCYNSGGAAGCRPGKAMAILGEEIEPWPS
jgi:hypothetical protein